jgi:hypothetical protein
MGTTENLESVILQMGKEFENETGSKLTTRTLILGALTDFLLKTLINPNTPPQNVAILPKIAEILLKEFETYDQI